MQNFGEQHPAFRYWHNTMARRVRVFDNGGKTLDRYSVIIARTVSGARVLEVYGMSADPQNPQGFNQYSHSAKNKFSDFAFLGKRVQVHDLPEAVIQAIENRIG